MITAHLAMQLPLLNPSLWQSVLPVELLLLIQLPRTRVVPRELLMLLALAHQYRLPLARLAERVLLSVPRTQCPSTC